MYTLNTLNKTHVFLVNFLWLFPYRSKCGFFTSIRNHGRRVKKKEDIRAYDRGSLVDEVDCSIHLEVLKLNQFRIV